MNVYQTSDEKWYSYMNNRIARIKVNLPFYVWLCISSSCSLPSSIPFYYCPHQPSTVTSNFRIFFAQQLCKYILVNEHSKIITVVSIAIPLTCFSVYPEFSLAQTSSTIIFFTELLNSDIELDEKVACLVMNRTVHLLSDCMLTS